MPHHPITGRKEANYGLRALTSRRTAAPQNRAHYKDGAQALPAWKYPKWHQVRKFLLKKQGFGEMRADGHKGRPTPLVSFMGRPPDLGWTP